MPYPVKGLLEVHEDMVEILLMQQVFLAEDPEIEYLFCGVPSRSETIVQFIFYFRSFEISVNILRN